jgi:subtilisin-like proprotein convertase family protein
MLQKNPNLNIQEARDYIRNNAQDAGPGGWDPVWGAGKLDCPAVINAMGGTNPTPVPTSTTPPDLPTRTPTVPPLHTPTPTTGPPPDELVVNSSDTPMVIPVDWSTLSSTIHVGSYHAAQAVVDINMNHSNLASLIATLEAPDGAWVYLYDTHQTIPISPPQDVQGAWVLRIVDSSGQGGVLNGWSLTFSGSGGTPGTTISCGQTVNGNIEETDEDYGDGTKFDTYTFSLPVQAQVTVQMYASYLQSYFEVFEGVPGNPIGDMKFSGTADVFGWIASASGLLDPGDYFIKANHIGTVFYYPQPYQLFLDCGGLEFPTATPTSVPATNTPVPTSTLVSVATATATPVPVNSPTPMITRSADLNTDGHINDTDMMILLDQWHRGLED